MGLSRLSCLFSIHGLFTGNGPFVAAENNSPLRSLSGKGSRWVCGSFRIDPVPACTREYPSEQHLGKENRRARRENTALSVATVHIDEFAIITQRYGKSAIDALVKDLQTPEKAIRGSDFAVRMASGDFLLILTECTLGESSTSWIA